MLYFHWGFSYLAAVIVLSVMVVPYIAKTTENSLRQVPTGYREGAEALGMSMGYSLRKVVLKTALPGIVTGLLLALAIAGGETAPLIYTANFANKIPHSVTHASFPYLTYVVFSFYDSSQVSVPLPRLRRRPDSGGHGADPPGGQPHHCGADPAARRGRPDPDPHAAGAQAGARRPRRPRRRPPPLSGLHGARLRSGDRRDIR